MLLEIRKNNWSLIGWTLIDLEDDLSVSRRQTVQSLKSQSRPHSRGLKDQSAGELLVELFLTWFRKQVVPC